MRLFYYFLITLLLIFSRPYISNAEENANNKITKVNHAVVLMYHRFGENKYPSTNIKIKQFIKHLNELDKNKYNVVTLDDALDAINDKILIPDRSIAITIDDAYYSVYKHAWPILKKYNFPFTLFVSTDVIDQKIPGYMSWDEIRDLRDNGVIIGSQTKSHPHMHKLSQNELEKELTKSNERFVEEIGDKPKIFAYPYGEYDIKVLNIVKNNGFVASFGQHSGVANKSLGMFQLPRFAMNEMYGNMERFKLAVNALPMPITDLSPINPVIKNNPPLYGFTLSSKISPLKRIRCFASHNIKSKISRLGKYRIEVRLDKNFPKGRGRINCTMEANNNRWRWLGRQFIIQ